MTSEIMALAQGYTDIAEILNKVKGVMNSYINVINIVRGDKGVLKNA